MKTDSAQPAVVPRTVLGRTGLEVSRLSIGAWGFGSASAAEAQVGTDEDLAEILSAAFRAGINFLDSAEAYDNEDRIGRILQQVDAPPDLVIATKFGHGRGFSADDFKRSAERSLKDLGVDFLPLMMVHDPRNDEDMDVVMGPKGALEGLRQLQDEGLVGHIGVATGTLPPLLRAVRSGEFDCIQFPRLYTLLNRAAKTTGLLQEAQDRNLGTLLAAPFGGNILATGTGRKPHPLYVYRPALPEVVDAVRAMEERCAQLGVSLPAAALAFALTEPLVDTTIVGVTRREELEWDLAALDVALSRPELESIAEAGTLDLELLGGPDFRMSWPADRVPPR